MTRNSMKVANEFKNLADNSMKSLASKEDIDSLNILIEEQSYPMKELGLKTKELEENVTANEEAIAKFN